MARATFGCQNIAITRLDSETHAYKQKSSEHQLVGIHTVWQTYFPINVSIFDIYNFGPPLPEVGIIDMTLVQ